MLRFVSGLIAMVAVSVVFCGPSDVFAQNLAVTIQENPSPPWDSCPVNNRELQVLFSGTTLGDTDTLSSATVDIEYDTLTWAFNSVHHDGEFSQEYSSLDHTAYQAILDPLKGKVRVTILPNQNLAAVKALGQPLSDTPLLAINHICFNPVTADAASKTMASGNDAIVLLSSLVIAVFAPIELPTGQPGFHTCKGDGSGDWGACTVNDIQGGSLPVELSSLNAVVEDEGVTLTWTTESEDNNAGFSIEHSAGDSDEFSELAFVEGKGTTLEQQTYTYRANGLDVGRHRFRLRQIDFDGSFKYSEEIEAIVELAGTHRLGAAYPNPFNPSTNFELIVGHTQHVKIDVINALGQRVQRLYDGMLEANDPKTFVFDAGTLPTGLYFYKVVGETFSQTRQMLLVK